MKTRDQAIALMRALDLTPDSAETEKKQTAIECALDEAVHRQRIAGQCPRCGKRELFVGVGGHLTCSNGECPEPNAPDRFMAEMKFLDVERTSVAAEVEGCPRLVAVARDLADLAARTVCEPRRFLNNEKGEQQALSVALIRVRTLLNIEATMPLPNRSALGEQDTEQPPVVAADGVEEPTCDHQWGVTVRLGDATTEILGATWARPCDEGGCDAILFGFGEVARGDDVREVVFVPEAEARLLKAVELEFAKMREGILTKRAEDAEKHIGELHDQLGEASRQRDVAQTDYGHLYRDYDRLQTDAAVLIASLDGSDGMPKAWWIVATEAVQRIDNLLHPEAAEVRGRPDVEKG